MDNKNLWLQSVTPINRKDNKHALRINQQIPLYPKLIVANNLQLLITYKEGLTWIGPSLLNKMIKIRINHPAISIINKSNLAILLTQVNNN